jgi:hypothetical protein
MTKATVYHNGLIVWRPPAIYRSLCPINVEFFPFDVQHCVLKIGSWSYDGTAVDIKHKYLPEGDGLKFQQFYYGIIRVMVTTISQNNSAEQCLKIDMMMMLMQQVLMTKLR